VEVDRKISRPNPVRAFESFTRNLERNWDGGHEKSMRFWTTTNFCHYAISNFKWNFNSALLRSTVETQPLCCGQVRQGHWKMKGKWPFVMYPQGAINIVPPSPIPLRQSLRMFQSREAFGALLPVLINE
jgi:hypothetical protein